MRILIIDDHALVREGISQVIWSLNPGITVLTAPDCATALQVAQDNVTDLILLDLQLPDRSGVEALRIFRERYPERPIVVVSAVEDQETVLKVLDLGAKAFIGKSADSRVLKEALGALLAGQIYLPESVVPKAANGQAQGPARKVNLTDRQLEVLSLLVAGLPNKLIARRLDIAEATVKLHVSAVMRELRVNSRTQALIAAAKAGFHLPIH